jgi:hypothetical protein
MVSKMTLIFNVFFLILAGGSYQSLQQVKVASLFVSTTVP